MITLNDAGKRRGMFIKTGAVIAGIAACLIMHACTASAASTALFEALRTYEIDATTDIFRNGFRMIGFGILKGLGRLSDSLYGSLTYIFESIDITYSSGIGTLIKKYKLIYKLLFTISVAAFGLYLVARTNTGQLNTLNCLMLIFLVVAAMPLMTEKLAKLTDAGTGYVQSKWAASAEDMKAESLSGTIMKDYIIDLEKVDRNIPSDNPKALKTAIRNNSGYNDFKNGGKDWRYIDINEPMNYNDKPYKKSFWDKKLEGSGSNKELADMGSSWTDLFDTYYYRYQMTSWLSPILMMLVLCVVFLFSGFRCATMIIEIIQAEIYMPFVAVTDLASGQRIKEGLKHFLTLFAGIFLCVALLGIYFICYSWINANIDDTAARIVFHLALAWAVLNGPNAIERILGVDVGVKDGWKILLGLNAAKATGAAGMAAVAAAGKAVSAPAHAVKWGMDKKDQAHGAMEKAKEKAGQYRQQSAEAKSEAGKWKPAGQTAGDPMGQPSNAAGENLDPMPEKDAGMPVSANAGDKQQEGGIAPDPMAQAQNETAKNAGPVPTRVDDSSDPPAQAQGNADPMSSRTEAAANAMQGTGQSAAISPHDPMQQSSGPVNRPNMTHGHTGTAPPEKTVLEPGPAVLDGKPASLKKGGI